jgi:hypothetical protein
MNKVMFLNFGNVVTILDEDSEVFGCPQVVQYATVDLTEVSTSKYLKSREYKTKNVAVFRLHPFNCNDWLLLKTGVPADHRYYNHPTINDLYLANQAQTLFNDWVDQGKPDARYDSEYDMSIHSNPDPDAWAEFFLKTWPDGCNDRDTMAGWFANAMMAKHDSDNNKYYDDDEVNIILRGKGDK